MTNDEVQHENGDAQHTPVWSFGDFVGEGVLIAADAGLVGEQHQYFLSAQLFRIMPGHLIGLVLYEPVRSGQQQSPHYIFMSIDHGYMQGSPPLPFSEV